MELLLNIAAQAERLQAEVTTYNASRTERLFWNFHWYGHVEWLEQEQCNIASPPCHGDDPASNCCNMHTENGDVGANANLQLAQDHRAANLCIRDMDVQLAPHIVDVSYCHCRQREDTE